MGGRGECVDFVRDAFHALYTRMSDIRNKIAKIEGLARDKAMLARLSRSTSNPLRDAQKYHALSAATLHAIAGAPNCRCGANAVRLHRGMPMCDACEDAAMNLEALTREAWSKPKPRKR